MSRYYEITAGADQVFYGFASLGAMVEMAKEEAVKRAKNVTIWHAWAPKVSRERKKLMTITPESALAGRAVGELITQSS